MEILQTIWNMLTTENAQLSNIIISPLTFVTLYLQMLTFTTILELNITVKQKVSYLLINSFIVILSLFFVPFPYYNFINMFIIPFLVFFIFRTTILKSILSEIIACAMSLLIGTPLLLIYTYIFKVTLFEINSIAIYRILYVIALYALFFLAYKTSKYFNMVLHIPNKLKNKSNMCFIVSFIIATIVIALQAYVELLYMDSLPNYLVFTGLLISFLYLLISLFSLARTAKLEVATQNLEEEKLYNQTLTLLYDNIRGFKHDFNNIVQGLGGYISTNNMEGLRKYYSEILDDCQKVNNLALLSPEVINNPAIYSLLTSKYHMAIELGIKVELNIFMDLSIINMPIYTLIRILGILLDNAIEAAKECDYKKIIITAKTEHKTNKQLFIVENTYTNKDVNLDEIFEKHKTSKNGTDAQNHGLGLWKVKQILKKSKNLNLHTTKTDEYFKQQFEILC